MGVTTFEKSFRGGEIIGEGEITTLIQKGLNVIFNLFIFLNNQVALNLNSFSD